MKFLMLLFNYCIGDIQFQENLIIGNMHRMFQKLEMHEILNLKKKSTFVLFYFKN